MHANFDRPTMHLGLRVSDLARSKAFYADLLGIPAAVDEPDYVKYELADPPLALSLVPGLPPQAEWPLHLGLRLASVEAVEAQLARLRDLGHEPADAGTSTCCYARQRKFWLHDPDGAPWEVYHRLGDGETRQDSSNACCAETVRGASNER